MKLRRFLGLTLGVLVCMAGGSAQAQFGPPGQSAGAGPGMGGRSPGMNPALAKIFGKNAAFTAKVQFLNLDAAGKEVLSGPAEFAFWEGNSSWNMDLAEMKNASVPPQAMAQMKTFGLSQMITITKADNKTKYQVYPGLQSYVEITLTPGSEGKVDKSEVKTEQVGKETINGVKCQKNRLTVAYEGKTQEILTWNASELKDFPVRVQFVEDGHTIRMDYQNVKLEKPDAKLFAPPAGFTKYETIQQMLQATMQKRLGAPPAP